MTDLLSAGQRAVLARVCELLVPGSGAIQPVEYIARVLPGMSAGDENAVHAAIGVMASVTDEPALAALAGGAAFERLRGLAIEAYYGGFAPSPPAGADVIVVGSGAGGGVIAAELAEAGADVLLIEAGGCCPAATRTRFGSEAMRATDAELAASGLADLVPWYERIERVLGVRERADWTPSVHRVAAGFRALGTTLRPTNAGRPTPSAFLAPVLGGLRLLTRHIVRSVSLKGRTVRGVHCVGPDDTESTIAARTVVLAAGALRTPQILLRSEDFTGLDTPSTRLVGRTLGLRPARLVYGRFAEPQDCHLTYPITAHCLDRQDDGVVVEGTTIQDPVSFARSLADGSGRPLWGDRLAGVVRDYRHWAGLLAMATDENTATVELDASGGIVVAKRFSAVERSRLVAARAFATEVLVAAGADDVVASGLRTTHPQGSARMGGDPAVSVVDVRGQAHDVRGLYVGDSSLLPVTLSVNPSLTVMALAAKVASHIVEELPT